MSYFDSKKRQKKRISFDNEKNTNEIEKELYQEYLRTKDKMQEKFVDSEHLENIFTNEIYYRAMKELPKLEKEILYLFVYEYKSFNDICKILKKSKREIKILRKKSIKHFIQNVKRYEGLAKKSGGLNE